MLIPNTSTIIPPLVRHLTKPVTTSHLSWASFTRPCFNGPFGVKDQLSVVLTDINNDFDVSPF